MEDYQDMEDIEDMQDQDIEAMEDSQAIQDMQDMQGTQDMEDILVFSCVGCGRDVAANVGKKGKYWGECHFCATRVFFGGTRDKATLFQWFGKGGNDKQGSGRGTGQGVPPAKHPGDGYPAARSGPGLPGGRDEESEWVTRLRQFRTEP